MPKSIPWHKVRHGLILAPNWVGDVVMSLPALEALRRALPATQLSIAARDHLLPVLQAAQLQFALHSLPSQPGLGSLTALRRALRGQRPDLSIAFPNSFHAGLLLAASGASIRAGYARDGRNFLLSHPVTITSPRAPGQTHESFYYFDLLRKLGLIEQLPQETHAQLLADESLVEQWNARLGASRPRVAIHAGASFGGAKRWLPERFLELGWQLQQRQHAQIILIGSAAERALATEIASGLQPLRTVNLAGQTSLPQLLALLGGCDLAICNDSGPMHLAAALGTPVVALFGPTNYLETFPLLPPSSPANQVDLVRAEGIECSPCKLRECPIDHRCMTSLTTAMVLAAAENMLARTAPRA